MLEEVTLASASPWARGGIVAGGIGMVAAASFFAGHALIQHGPDLVPASHAIGVSDAVPLAPWTADDLAALTTAVDKAAGEGLDPLDYSQAALHAAVAQHQSGPQTDALATRAALVLAHDYAAGHLTHRTRFDWYIPYAGPNATKLARGLTDARRDGRLGAWLASLLPSDDQYAALRAALAMTPASEQGRRDRIRVNMERWRWLPRQAWAGDKLYVNLPTYELKVQRIGKPETSYRVVIGAPDKRTPILAADVRTVVANPTWIVPASIVKSSKLRPGGRYQFITSGGHLRVVQKAGPGNALGRVKIEIPNNMAIYLHDTPSKSLFSRDARAFSHGCVRVQNIEALAADVLDDNPRLATALEGQQTRYIKVSHRWRTEIVYLTMRAGPDGQLTDLGDPYQLDAPMAAALSGRVVSAPVLAPADRDAAKIARAKAASAAPDPEAIVPAPAPPPVDTLADPNDTADRSHATPTPDPASPAASAHAPAAALAAPPAP